MTAVSHRAPLPPAVCRWLSPAAGTLVFAVTLVLYTATMTPTVSFWDTGEFITSAYTLGVPHPPGAPLYVLLGRLFSLAPVGTVATRVVFMSVLASATAALCTYGSLVALARRALGGGAGAFGDARDLSVVLGAAVGALALTASYTFWFNGTEAEVYAYSLLFACGGLWLILRWDAGGAGVAQDRWLLLIAYVFGLGGGVHLLCLLTLPALVWWAWCADRGLRVPVAVAVSAGLTGLVLIAGFAPQPVTARLLGLSAAAAAAGFLALAGRLLPEARRTVVLLASASAGLVGVRAVAGNGAPTGLAAGLAAAWVLVHLWRHDRRAFGLIVGVAGLFALGYSTYLALFIRSGLDPALDMNDPETWRHALAFLNREQYGTDSQLLGMLTPQASRTYQLWDQQVKYLLQQWPFPLWEHEVLFRRATGPEPHAVAVSAVPWLLGLAGLGWQLRRDVRGAVGLLGLFLVMGLGLSLYLNMPDPQPRERHYVYGGPALAWALWMGLGWTAMVEAVRVRAGRRIALVAAVAVVGLLLPAGAAVRLYPRLDRSDNWIAHDYAYNLLQSCEADALLFTNGDNDTFPLWYLQEVEGIRRDVRVVNLSLLNTGWYIRQLRDREPRVRMPLTDDYIEEVLTDTERVDLLRRLWPEPRRPLEFERLGLDVQVAPPPGYDLLRVQDVMTIGVLAWNDWARPVHFALTVAPGNRVGLDPYLEMEGMTLRLRRQRVGDGEVREPGERPGGTARLAHNLRRVYRYRGVADDGVHKDDNTRRLLQNYRACVLSLADAYRRGGRHEELAELLRWGQETVGLGWESDYLTSQHYRQNGRPGLALEFLERASRRLSAEHGIDPGATYPNALALAHELWIQHADSGRAGAAYRRAIALAPDRYVGHQGWAAALQAAGDPARALAVVGDYLRSHPDSAAAQGDREILRRALAAAGSMAGATTEAAMGSAAGSAAGPAGDEARP